MIKLRKKARRCLLEVLELMSNEKVDAIEEALIAKGLQLLVSEYTDKQIPEAATRAVSKEIVKCLNLINSRLQNRLREE